MKRRFENEDSPASILFFVETVPSPPNDFVPHRFRQVFADPGSVQETTEHYKVLRPFVLPPPSLLHVCLLFTGDLFFG